MFAHARPSSERIRQSAEQSDYLSIFRIQFQGRQQKGIPSFYIMSLGEFAHCRHAQSGNVLI